MGDGAPDLELALKRNKAKVKQFEFQVESQELELMEFEGRKQQLIENVAASRRALDEARADFDASEKALREVKTDG